MRKLKKLGFMLITASMSYYITKVAQSAVKLDPDLDKAAKKMLKGSIGLPVNW
jgi:hypothetical protein